VAHVFTHNPGYQADGEGITVNVVERFAEAFNRGDVDGLLACFTGDATYGDLFYGPHAGHAALRGMFERMFREGRDYRWQMNSVVMDAHRAAAEWTFSYTATAAVPRSEGRHVRFSGMSVFELDGGDLDGGDLEGGRARAYREYADTGVALLQLGFAPESLAKVLARRLPTA
jgi:steroid delta-isomerase-like uncharacterized protein